MARRIVVGDYAMAPKRTCHWGNAVLALQVNWICNCWLRAARTVLVSFFSAFRRTLCNHGQPPNTIASAATTAPAKIAGCPCVACWC